MSVPLPPSGTCVRCVSRFRWVEFFFCCHQLTTISVCVALAWRVKVRFFFTSLFVQRWGRVWPSFFVAASMSLDWCFSGCL